MFNVCIELNVTEISSYAVRCIRAKFYINDLVYTGIQIDGYNMRVSHNIWYGVDADEFSYQNKS